MLLELPVIPLRNTVVLPHATMPVDVGRVKSKRAVDEAMSADRLLLLVAQRDPEVDDPSSGDLYGHAVLTSIKQLMRLPDGTLQVVVEAKDRVRLQSFVQTPYLRAHGELLAEQAPQDAAVARVLIQEIVEAFERYVSGNKNLRLDRYQLEAVQGTTDGGVLADTVTQYTTWDVADKMRVLAEVSVEERLKLVLNLLLRELERFDLDKRIAQQVKEQMDQNQREYYLREQMKAIQKELGGGEELAAEVVEMRERIEKAGMPAEVEERAGKEVQRLERMQPGSPEATIIRTYLDWMIELPWSSRDQENLDLRHTREILDQDHYGLEEVKGRILEFLAVRKMVEGLDVKKRAPILCLIGPPGVGKTSLGRSVARSMNRRFHHISLGGIRDEAEVRGHRRTYIGAMPGKIIQGMKQVGVKNPVFLLDEIDKLGADWRGDPSSAMLEVLDPEQNNTFTDNYLEIPYDLSEVMFITTANQLSTIPEPLQDRMEVIDIPGYTMPEREKIAELFLWDRQLESSGMQQRLSITKPAIAEVVTKYTREAGVRNLERELGKIARRGAKNYLEEPWEGIRKVDVADLTSYLGVPKFRPERAEKEAQVGVAQGLAWTPVGGVLLTVEAMAVPGTGKLSLTGNLGEVMKESAQAALTYLRKHAESWSLPENFHTLWDLHVHVPEGATPKDGPSAGITMATAIASALTGHPVRMDTAMTGEITLRGKVLAIGGVKEKLLAAHQAGLSKVILPEDNRAQLEEVPEEIRRELEIQFVANVGQVLEMLLLPDLVQDRLPARLGQTIRQPSAGA